MRNLKLFLYKNGFSSLLICALFAWSLQAANAQVCTAVTAPTTINGINVTGAGTGSVNIYSNGTFSSCTGASQITTPNNALYLGLSGAFTYTYTFSQPVNNLKIIITGTGSTFNENFIFTSNGGGTPSITSSTSCVTTISGNEIISGAGATTNQGGGGEFTITNAAGGFTTLTISGAGGNSGSLLALCSASVAAACTTGTTAPALSATTLSNVCPSVTANLTALHAGTVPVGASLVWFTNNAHTGTAYGTPATAGAGTYYAFYYDTVSDCYSPASTAVAVTITAPCATADLTVTLENSLSVLAVGASSDITVYVENIKAVPTSSTVSVTISKPTASSGLVLSIDPSPDWTVAQTATQFTLTLVGNIAALDTKLFTAKLTRTGGNAGTYNFTPVIANSAGGDTNNLNNRASVVFTKN